MPIKGQRMADEEKFDNFFTKGEEKLWNMRILL